MRNSILILILSLFLSLSVLSCANTNSNLPRQTRDTFVKIEQTVTIIVCNPNNKKECVAKDSKSSGSGAVVKVTPAGSYVLTAGHVCEFENHSRIAREVNASSIHVFMESIDFELARYTSEIINIDRNIDTCLLFAHNLWSREEARLASPNRSLKEGDRVYNVAAPVGIFYRNVVPILEGFFMGNRDVRAYYSIPAMGGSSGSPIFNSNSELIGMIHSVNVYFPVISVSPPKDMLIKFVENSIAMGEEMRAAKLKGKSE
jgi:S1-C subfamily serine protease